MDPITSQRGRKRAEDEKAVLLKQLSEIDAKRKASNLTYDGMAAMVEGQLREVTGRIAEYDNGNDVQATLPVPGEGE